MKKKTLLLLQLSLLIFTFYVLMNCSENLRLLLSLSCLLVVFVIGRVENSLTERSKQENDKSNNLSKKDEIKTISQALEYSLKSKNVLLLTDAIQYLLRDIGLAVSPSKDHPAIDRQVIIPGIQLTCGMKILSDVAELNENWDKWEKLSGFDQGKGGKQRLLLIGSNRIKEPVDRKKKYRNFSVNAQELLFARKVVAMTTRTFCKIYLSCKKKKLDIRTIFFSIKQHPGGVFQIEH